MNFVLTLWMAAMAGAGAQTNPADVRFTHYGLVSLNAVRLGDECYVPLSSLVNVGFTTELVGTNAKIDAGTGKVDSPIRMVNGKEMVPLRRVVQNLGGKAEWDKETPDTLDVKGDIQKITVKDGHITIEGKLLMRANVFYLYEPQRTVFDFKGYVLDEFAEVKLTPEARAQQYKPDTVRLVVNTSGLPDLPTKIGPSAKLDVFVRAAGALTQLKPGEEPSVRSGGTKDFGGNDPASIGGLSTGKPNATTSDPKTGPANEAVVRVDTSTTMSGYANKNLGDLVIEHETSREANLTMNFAAPVQPHIHRFHANYFEITLPDTEIRLTDGFDLKSPSFKDFTVRKDGSATVLGFTLKRPMGVQLGTNGNSLNLRILKPTVGDNRLSSKTIVVDAGHGGKDAGCHTPDMSVKEKNLTLQIARLVAQDLAAEGATVLMTRNSDVYIPVDERPAIANRSGADLFVSIHINSHPINKTVQGSQVYYHFRRPVEEPLAMSISDAIKEETDIGSQGPKPDNGRFATGYGVLRLAQMPAVLVETGFIGTPHDRKLMVDADFQASFAHAIVKGIKVYLGNGN